MIFHIVGFIFESPEYEKDFLVEDDQAIREVFEMVLTSENYDVQSFSSVSAFTQRDINVISDLYILSYGEALKRYIFDPLQITSAGLDYKKLVSKCKATGYVILSNNLKQEAEIYDSPEPFAAGVIYATADQRKNRWMAAVTVGANKWYRADNIKCVLPTRPNIPLCSGWKKHSCC